MIENKIADIAIISTTPYLVMRCSSFSFAIGDSGFLPTILLSVLSAIRVTTLALVRTGRAGIRAMLTAIVLTASRYTFSLFCFAVAAAVSAILVCHCYLPRLLYCTGICH